MLAENWQCNWSFGCNHTTVIRQTNRAVYCNETTVFRQCDWTVSCSYTTVIRECNSTGGCNHSTVIRHCNWTVGCNWTTLIRHCNWTVGCNRLTVIRQCNWAVCCNHTSVIRQCNRPCAARDHMVQNMPNWSAKESYRLWDKTQLTSKVWFFFVLHFPVESGTFLCTPVWCILYYVISSCTGPIGLLAAIVQL